MIQFSQTSSPPFPEIMCSYVICVPMYGVVKLLLAMGLKQNSGSEYFVDLGNSRLYMWSMLYMHCLFGSKLACKSGTEFTFKIQFGLPNFIIFYSLSNFGKLRDLFSF